MRTVLPSSNSNDGEGLAQEQKQIKNIFRFGYTVALLSTVLEVALPSLYVGAAINEEHCNHGEHCDNRKRYRCARHQRLCRSTRHLKLLVIFNFGTLDNPPSERHVLQ